MSDRGALSCAVIITVHDRHEFLDEAIGSLRAQRRAPDRIVVVDDGSTREETLEHLAVLAVSDDVQVVRIENRGLPGARNVGRTAAAEDVLVFFDDDDVLGPDYLAQTVGALEIDDSLAVAYTRARLFGSIEQEWALPDYDRRAIVLDNMVYAAAAVRAAAFDDVGGYREELTAGREDHDLWLRLTQAGYGFWRSDAVAFFYRQTDSSMNHSIGGNVESMAKTYAAISRGSAEHTMANIDVLWEEVFALRADVKRYRRLYGGIDSSARNIKEVLRRVSGRAEKKS